MAAHDAKTAPENKTDIILFILFSYKIFCSSIDMQGLEGVFYGFLNIFIFYIEQAM